MYVYKETECKTIQSGEIWSNNCIKENSNSIFQYSKRDCKSIKDTNRGEI